MRRRGLLLDDRDRLLRGDVGVRHRGRDRDEHEQRGQDGGSPVIAR